MTRRVALVSGHFAPSNLVGAHRARLWSRYLPEFGWEPIVVTGDPKLYEERPDPDLDRLVAPGLRVIHAPTMSTRPVRLVGDIGVRAFRGCYREVAALAAAGEIDFVLVTIPSNFLAPVGRLVHRRYGVPFGIDYQDPWVNRWPGVDRPFSRAWASYRLATLLEPWAVRDAALITGMAPGYVAGMLERNPAVAKGAVLAYMPMGSAPEDYDLVRGLQRPPFLFQPGRRPIPHDLCRRAAAGRPRRARCVPVGTEGAARKRTRDGVTAARAFRRYRHARPTIRTVTRCCRAPERRASRRWSSEHPHRIGYVDTLNHLMQSDAVLVLGSTEPHYTPSKVFQAMLSQRPVFAMLHAEEHGGRHDPLGAGRAGTDPDRGRHAPARTRSRPRFGRFVERADLRRERPSTERPSKPTRRASRHESWPRRSILPATPRTAARMTPAHRLPGQPSDPVLHADLPRAREALRPDGVLRPSPDGRSAGARGLRRGLRLGRRPAVGIPQPVPRQCVATSHRPTASPAATRPASRAEIAGGRFDAFVVPGWGLRSYLQAVAGLPTRRRAGARARRFATRRASAARWCGSPRR